MRKASIQGVLALCAAVFGVSAQADAFTSKPAVVQVAATAGGPTDRQFRVLAPIFRKYLSQPMVVENKTGAGGALAVSTLAASAKPDGYTLAQAQPAVFRLPHMQKVSWDPIRDLSYVIGIGTHVLGVAVRADSLFQSWNDLVPYARANPESFLMRPRASAGPCIWP